MNNNNLIHKNHSRRSFLGGSAAAIAAASFLPLSSCGNASTESNVPVVPESTSGKLSSKFGGVQIGTITYSWRDMPGGLDNIIKYCHETGINSIELMSNDLEEYLGAPESLMRMIMAAMRAANPPAPAGGPPAGPMRRPQFTPEQQAQIDTYNEEIKKWRLSLSMSDVARAKKLLDDAGIQAHIVKFSPSRWSDDEIDYAFQVAKAMGAGGVTEEISEDAVRKLAPFAEKHGMYAIFHNHMQFAEDGFSYDPFFEFSPAVMMNFDSGHFFGSTGVHPNDIIKKYHDRIYSMHIKDKTGPNTEIANTNQVWGQGEMPLEEVLLLIKKEQYPIYCDIELEYDIKPWSNSVKEVRNCVNYARQILI